MTTEEIYHRLRSLVRDQDAAWTPDCGSGAGGGRRPWEMPIGDDAPDDGSTDDAQAELIRHETASQIRSHVREHGTQSVPQHLRDWAEGILEPLVDWRRELRAAVSRGLSQAAGRADYTFARPPRRRVPGYTTPGMAAPAPPSVAVVVDTSGSMSQDDLSQCIADIAGLVRSVSGTSGAPAVRVIPCDTDAGQVSIVRSRADVPRIRLTGGGGTDMGAGIDAAVGLRPTPDVVVTLTDGYTPWPERAPAAAPRARHIAVVLAERDVADLVPSWIHTIRR
jgi:predicted metal-dependent peptidase